MVRVAVKRIWDIAVRNFVQLPKLANFLTPGFAAQVLDMKIRLVFFHKELMHHRRLLPLPETQTSEPHLDEGIELAARDAPPVGRHPELEVHVALYRLGWG